MRDLVILFIHLLPGSWVLAACAPGEFAVAEMEWHVGGLSGPHQVYAVVDPFDQIPEIWQNRWQQNLLRFFPSSRNLVRMTIENGSLECRFGPCSLFYRRGCAS